MSFYPTETSSSTQSFTPSVILLTGGAGFIGSHVIIELLKNYPTYRVICLDKLDTCSSLHNLDEVKNNPNFRLVIGDIANVKLVQDLLVSESVDTILHFAAQTHVDNSFGNSIHFTDQNIRGTHLLLENIKSLNSQIKRFIHVSTDEVYGEGSLHSDESYDEKSILNPTNPYAATKCAAEFLVKSYAISFDIPAIITRGNNVFGPHQFPEKIIPKFISLLSQGKPCPLHGTGDNRRSFLYVKDVARAFDTILHKGLNHHIYNIGSTEEISNKELLKLLIQLFRTDGRLDPTKTDDDYIFHVADRAFNDQRYHINSTTLHKLGWSQESIDFKTHLKTCIDWYLSHPNHWDEDIVQTALVPHPIINECKTKFRWLIYGYKGWIGQQVCDIINSWGETVLCGMARANDVSKIEEELLLFKPDRIISLIGRTHGLGYTTIDYLEQKGKLIENTKDNLYSPLVLATLAKKYNIHLTYLGTGCIFTYDDQHPTPFDEVSSNDELGFTEDDTPNFFSSAYSTVKGVTDQLMNLQFGDSVLNVRIRMPINEDVTSSRNFITKIITYDKICSIPNSMTVLPELLPIMLNLAKTRRVGTINLTNPGYISHNQILSMYRDIVDPDFKWKNFTQEEQDKILAAGRSNNTLSTKKLRQLVPQVPDICQSVKDIMYKIKNGSK